MGDDGNDRVLYFPTAGSANASRVYGQFGLFTTSTDSGPVTPLSLGGPSAGRYSLFSDPLLADPLQVALLPGGALAILDRFDVRVVLYAMSSSTNVSVVYGQASFLSFVTATTQSSLGLNPLGMCADITGSERSFPIREYRYSRLSLSRQHLRCRHHK